MSSNTDREQAIAELLALHAQDRRAHFDLNIELLVGRNPDPMISVSNGEIHRSTKDAQRAMFTNYFEGSTFHEWDDLEPPIVRVSDDATMAWMIVRTQIRFTKSTEGMPDREGRAIYAGIMTYEKQNGQWIRVANVSTFAPQ